MSFLDVKAQTRRDVHRAFAVPCVLTTVAGSFAVTARLHGKMVISGDLNGEGYSTVIEGVFRAVFNREELAALDGGSGIIPERGDTVKFANYHGDGQLVTVELDARDDYDGPIDEKWSVTAA